MAVRTPGFMERMARMGLGTVEPPVGLAVLAQVAVCPIIELRNALSDLIDIQNPYRCSIQHLYKRSTPELQLAHTHTHVLINCVHLLIQPIR